jgi:hypothetical protein
MLTKVMGAIVISVVSVVTTLLVQSVLSSHGTSAAGKPHQTTPPTKTTCSGVASRGAVGTVDSVGSNSFTITTAAGKTVTVNVSSSTTYRGAGGSASFSDVHKGAVVIVKGTAGTNSSVNATAVAIVPPHAAGKVTAINGGALTIQPPSGNLGKLASTVTTVVTNGSTTYFAPGSSSTGFGAIKVGSYIAATGTLSSDGKTLTATKVIVAPAGFSPNNLGIGSHPLVRGMLRGFLSRIGSGSVGPMGLHSFWMHGSTNTAPGSTA